MLSTLEQTITPEQVIDIEKTEPTKSTSNKVRRLRNLGMAGVLSLTMNGCYYLQKGSVGGLYWTNENSTPYNTLAECEKAKVQAERRDPSYLFRCDPLGLPL